jgi:hypothetical protein
MLIEPADGARPGVPKINLPTRSSAADELRLDIYICMHGQLAGAAGRRGSVGTGEGRRIDRDRPIMRGEVR